MHQSSSGYTSAEELIYESAAIVIAEFVGEVEERFEFQSPAVDHTGDFRLDVLRTYRVSESLKGPIRAGQEIVIWHTRGLEDRRGFVIDYEMPKATTGRTYALFLRPTEREDGKTYWGQMGDPGFAEVQGQSLRFEPSGHYREAMQGRGVTVQPSGAPFSLSLALLRDLAERSEPPPPSPTPTATGGGTSFPTKDVPPEAD